MVSGAECGFLMTSLLDREASQFPCLQEYAGEHGAIEAAGVGVAQGWVIGGEKMQPVGKTIAGAVGEAVLGFAGDDAGVEQVGEIAVEGDLSQTDDDADAREGANLIGEVSGAVANLLRVGLVAGRGAANDGGDPGVAELEAVVAGDGAGFGGEAKLVQDGIHEVAGAVAGEGTAGAVGSMGSGGEAEDEDAGARVAEAGDGAGPVGLVLVGAPFGLADAAAVVAKTGAAFAGDDGLVNLLEERRRGLRVNSLGVGGYHCIHDSRDEG
jgi:hypothetical protein